MRNYSNAERLWYNFKADLRWWREVLFGTSWSEIEGNENKKKPCLFIRFLDCISRDVEEGGQIANRNSDENERCRIRTEKFLSSKFGYKSSAKNAKRFL